MNWISLTYVVDSDPKSAKKLIQILHQSSTVLSDEMTISNRS